VPKQNPPPKYSILILTYNRVDLIEARLAEIERLYAYRRDLEIRVLDNGGNDSGGTNLFLLSRTRDWPNETGSKLYVNRIAKNIGFGPGFNYLAKDALGDVIFIVSDDVKILGDFITPVAEAIEAFPNSLVCQEMISGPSGWNQFGGTVIDYPAGYFLACTKKMWWEVIGGFDDRYVPYDYEDVDLGMALEKLQIPMVRMEHLPIKHMVAGTIGFNPERYENTVLQRKRFAEKWELPNVPERP